MGTYISPNQLFQPASIPGDSWHSFMLGKTWGFPRSMGEAVSVIIALIMIARIFWFLLKLVINWHFIYSVQGCSTKLLWSLCSEVLLSVNYRKAFNLATNIYCEPAKGWVNVPSSTDREKVEIRAPRQEAVYHNPTRRKAATEAIASVGIGPH